MRNVHLGDQMSMKTKFKNFFCIWRFVLNLAWFDNEDVFFNKNSIFTWHMGMCTITTHTLTPNQTGIICRFNVHFLLFGFLCKWNTNDLLCHSFVCFYSIAVWMTTKRHSHRIANSGISYSLWIEPETTIRSGKYATTTKTSATAAAAAIQTTAHLQK